MSLAMSHAHGTLPVLQSSCSTSLGRRAPLAHAWQNKSTCSRRQRRPSPCCASNASDPVTGNSDSKTEANSASSAPKSAGISDAEKKVASFTRSAATTFAPRASTATKNPAYKGSTLYTIFGVQAWLSILVGALLSFNLIFPTEQPSIARLIGMWSIWMFTVPALRARECSAPEKDALNLLFLLIPLINVGLPFVWKSFPFIFSADVAAMGGIYLWKVGLPGHEKEA